MSSGHSGPTSEQVMMHTFDLTVPPGGECVQTMSTPGGVLGP
eukprot:CAMPEP_0172915350 /NCGR_PEP_ID=MMETSP1075-20121228/194154_1 /TAXON_ID=2916 /ORGANISM="Ceratium fusus, Strain PA161109" /LENGTH=41 /DNA_ID= /DNA_START= /DNA_END= /DNA_ORIENTATION=